MPSCLRQMNRKRPCDNSSWGWHTDMWGVRRADPWFQPQLRVKRGNQIEPEMHIWKLSAGSAQPGGNCLWPRSQQHQRQSQSIRPLDNLQTIKASRRFEQKRLMFQSEFIVRFTTITQQAYFPAFFWADEITVTAEQLGKKTNLELRIVFWCSGSPQTPSQPPPALLCTFPPNTRRLRAKPSWPFNNRLHLLKLFITDGWDAGSHALNSSLHPSDMTSWKHKQGKTHQQCVCVCVCVCVGEKENEFSVCEGE